MSLQQPRHVLRSLLRLVKTPALPTELMQKQSATQAQHCNNVRRLVLEEFRNSKTNQTNANDESNKTNDTKLMFRYQELLQNLQERQRLFDLDQGAEERFSPKELSRRAAARAGLQLPESYST